MNSMATELQPDEDDAVALWAEIHRLRAAVQGPDGYATWQEAATAERVRRVQAEKAPAKFDAQAAEQAAPVQQVGELDAFEAWFSQFRHGWKTERDVARDAWQAALSTRPELSDAVAHTYSSTQATNCASCGEHKHTPLRIDAMGGYVCLTCIDKKLGGILGEFGYAPDAEIDALRRDAERYRAVRDDDCHPYAICIWDEDDGWAQDARKPDVVDAAIDAALAAWGEKR